MSVPVNQKRPSARVSWPTIRPTSWRRCGCCSSSRATTSTAWVRQAPSWQPSKRGQHDLALIDLNYARDTTSGVEGLDLLPQLRQVDQTLPVVVMTAWGTVGMAVEAMHRGAGDFIQKPWENARLLAVLRTQVELGRALRRTRRLEAENALLRPAPAASLVAESPAMRPVLQVLARVGPSDAQRADHRRERHRQDDAGAGAARRLASRRRAVRRREHRRALRDAGRQRVVRPRTRRVHRCASGAPGPLRGRRRRHAVPGRDRQHAGVGAGKTPARPRDARVRAPRVVAHATDRRAPAVGVQRRPPGRSGTGALPPRPAVSAQHRRSPHASPA